MQLKSMHFIHGRWVCAIYFGIYLEYGPYLLFAFLNCDHHLIFVLFVLWIFLTTFKQINK